MIELIVVVAILAVLGGIAFPLIMQFRESGDLTKCQSNLRQLAAVGQKYGADFMHKDMLPVSGMEDDPDTFMDESAGWWVSVAPEINGVEMPEKEGERLILPGIFHCPKDLRVKIDEQRGFLASPKSVSYVSWTDNSQDDKAETSAIKLRQQNLDTLPWLSDGLPVAKKSVQTPGDFRKMVWAVRDRHSGRVVVAYASGAVKTYDLKEFSSPDEAFRKIAPGISANAPKKPKKNRKK